MALTTVPDFLVQPVFSQVNGIGRMSRDSTRDQFVCRTWITRVPLWSLLATSTYAIVITAFERYVAVVYPIWYSVSEC